MLYKYVCRQRVLSKMCLRIAPITLYMDSKSAICFAKNPLYHKRSKHNDITTRLERRRWVLFHCLSRTYRKCVHGCGYFHESTEVRIIRKTCHECHRVEGTGKIGMEGGDSAGKIRHYQAGWYLKVEFTMSQGEDNSTLPE